MTFDLNILPLYREEGHDKLDLPGVHVAMPPRRAARVRNQDRLIIYMHFAGKGVVLRDQLDQLLGNIEKSYYSRTGTITSTLQSIIEEINDLLLEQNLKYSSNAQQAVAYLSLAVLRRDMLYIAQAGPMHAFLLSSDKTEHFYESQVKGRGLGLGRSVSVNFFQATLSAGTLLLFLPKLPGGWNQNTLKDAHGQNLGVLRRRFLSDAGMDIKALVVETIKGNGDLYLLATESNTNAQVRKEAPAQPELSDSPKPEAIPAVESVDMAALPTETSPEPQETPVPEVLSRSETIDMEAAIPEQERSPRPNNEEFVSKPARELPDLGPILKNIVGKIGGWLGKALGAIRGLFNRMLPDEEEFKLSPSMMAFIAVIIPVVVVAVSALIYARVGLSRQYDVYFERADQAMITVQAGVDQSIVHDTLTAALVDLNRAEDYQITEESQALKVQIQGYLDTFDYVKRIDFQPAIAGNLSSSVNIKRMIATGRDLYMLDSTSGTVMRAWLTGTGYQMDPNFSCGPGSYGPYIVSEIVDIAPLPRDSQKEAALVGLDINGNLIYCEADEAPYAVPLAPPHSNWGQPTAITIENGNLYVLDPITNAVWIYFGEDDKFDGIAYFFFSEQVPNLQTAIDMTVSQNDLLVLHSDGHTTLCTYSILEEAPTECEDPALLKDERPGRENAATISDARFFQISYTQPPEPSIYFLDPIARSIYHFSLKLNLIQQLRSETELPPGVVTAFAISPTRSLFIALDHEVYIAFLP